MFKHILIATDGSELAERCVGQGLSLAQFLRCRVTIVTVTAPYSKSGIFGGMLDDEEIVVRYNQSWGNLPPRFWVAQRTWQTTYRLKPMLCTL
ncbi:universal stress protein [Brucella pituitosa]|uniref:universal stress protein n=1 Tax=Brucella pituitosa TaxID=571256 RepID=UPI000CFFADC5|nr:hypothetical protein CQ062_21770 [Ochrobactrum sp. MYb68]